MRRIVFLVASGFVAAGAVFACDEHVDPVALTPAPDTGAPPPASTTGGPAPAVDAGAPDVVVDAPPDAPAPMLLSAQGLYQDMATKTIAANVVEYAPAYPLWSDGLQKRRFIVLPAGAVIDTSNMDHWQMPVGTKFFKEFAEPGGKRIETRLIERRANTGSVGTDYFFSSFLWRADESDAELAPNGQKNALGTTHDVPSQAQCNACHGGDTGFILGFSAIQLSKPGAPPTLKSLAADGKLSNPPPANTDYPVPGDATTAAALGALHANCGHCHQPAGFAYDATHMVLRLSVSERDAAASQPYLTTVGVALDEWQFPPFTKRVVAKNPAQSAIVYRMSQRGNTQQMPPLATKIVDDAGLAAVETWISNLP